ncbi:hypothetical protein I5535_05110 [Rhodobacteraceae bacterium F11138]|nr:hypothetical protein [Rhodobacteraceae bacterium F11138]
MFLELIGTVFAGIAMAGIIMGINRLTAGRLPRWAAPVAGGLTMIAVTIFMEYSWYDRTATGLPDGVEVAQAVPKHSLYQPWTYVSPYVDRFVAVDEHSLKRNPDQPGQRIIDLYFFGRWAPSRKVPVVYDCAEHRLATLIDGIEFGQNGEILNADWRGVAADDPVLTAVCEVS